MFGPPFHIDEPPSTPESRLVALAAFTVGLGVLTVALYVLRFLGAV